MRIIKKVIIHCSATPEGKDFDVDDIRRWHVNGNGWSDVGYHYVINLDGKIDFGRSIERAGSHTRGLNTYSVGICYIGGVDENGNPKDTRTDAQKKALRLLCKALANDFDGVTFHGHNEFSSKACPSFNVKDENYGV